MGQGGFGTAWRALDTEQNCEVCVKILDKENIMMTSNHSFNNEYNVGVACLNHPNVLKLHGGGSKPYIIAGKPTKEKWYITSELAENGDLFEWVVEMGGLPE